MDKTERIRERVEEGKGRVREREVKKRGSGTRKLLEEGIGR